MDASRARLFTFERTSEAEGLHEKLTERRDLVDPARRERAGDLFAGHPATARTGNLQYTIDDHREAYVEKLDAEFSKTVVSELVEMLRSTHASKLIVCASPRMLGELRAAGRELHRGALVVDEIPRNLVTLTPTELREQLAKYGLLPAPPPRQSQA